MSNTAIFPEKILIKPILEGGLPPAPPWESETQGVIPLTYSLEQNYPNPFNPMTVIEYTLANRVSVRIQIYNVLGEVVTTLIDGIQDPGVKHILWDASNMPSGVYYCRLATGSFIETRKMILVR